MPDTRLLHDVAIQIAQGVDAATAIRRVRLDLGARLAFDLDHGMPLTQALHAHGAPGELFEPIRSQAHALGSFGPRALAQAAVMVVGGSDDVAGIPSASCLHRHLPPDREPTADEFQEAWRKCRDEQRS